MMAGRSISIRTGAIRRRAIRSRSMSPAENRAGREESGLGSISNVTRDGRYALLGRVRSRGNNNLHLLDLTTGQDTLITPHEGAAQYFGEIAKDGRAVYMASNESRDLAAFARLKLECRWRAWKDRSDSRTGGCGARRRAPQRSGHDGGAHVERLGTVRARARRSAAR